MALQNTRSVTEVLQDILGNVQEIIRSEFRLAKTEVQEEMTKAGQSSVPLGAGIVLAVYAVGFLLLAIVYALATAIAVWLAALIVSAGATLGAAVLLSLGRKRLKQVRLPEKTITSVKENVQWAKSQIR